MPVTPVGPQPVHVSEISDQFHVLDIVDNSGLRGLRVECVPTCRMELVSEPPIDEIRFECPIELSKLDPKVDSAIWLPRGGKNASNWDAEFKDIACGAISSRGYQPFKLTEQFEGYITRQHRDPITNAPLKKDDILIQTNAGAWKTPFLMDSNLALLQQQAQEAPDGHSSRSSLENNNLQRFTNMINAISAVRQTPAVVLRHIEFYLHTAKVGAEVGRPSLRESALTDAAAHIDRLPPESRERGPLTDRIAAIRSVGQSTQAVVEIIEALLRSVTTYAESGQRLLFNDSVYAAQAELELLPEGSSERDRLSAALAATGFPLRSTAVIVESVERNLDLAAGSAQLGDQNSRDMYLDAAGLDLLQLPEGSVDRERFTHDIAAICLIAQDTGLLLYNIVANLNTAMQSAEQGQPHLLDTSIRRAVEAMARLF